jgi:hypothetical protein
VRTPSSSPADFKLRHYQGPEHGQYQHCLVGLAPAVGARVIRLQVYHHDLEWLPLATGGTLDLAPPMTRMRW